MFAHQHNTSRPTPFTQRIIMQQQQQQHNINNSNNSNNSNNNNDDDPLIKNYVTKGPLYYCNWREEGCVIKCHTARGYSDTTLIPLRYVICCSVRHCWWASKLLSINMVALQASYLENHCTGLGNFSLLFVHRTHFMIKFFVIKIFTQFYVLKMQKIILKQSANNIHKI